jgi:putative inorganic carbon (HCO3(-)) transporter
MTGRAPLAAMTAVGALAIGALALTPAWVSDRAVELYVPAVALLALVSGAFVVWRVHPAYTLSAAIFLTPFAGHWPKLGLPGPLSPDRLLFVAAIGAVILRAPPIADRPRLRISGAHWLLAVASLYALGSALAAGTLLQAGGFLKILDAFGILPFLAFLVAPLAFPTPYHRRVLLGTLVALGAYLGFTTLSDALNLDALVFPKYILDLNYGGHAGRGRGPFVDAVANGLALYTCAVACGIAVATWRTGGMRAVAVVVGLVCIVGTFLSLERSVWLGVVVGTTVAMLATRGTRAYFVPVVAAIGIAVTAAFFLLPGMSERAADRLDDKRMLWDRKNLDRAALNMVEARPLTGFGWARFTTYSEGYFEQADDYPITAAGVSHRNRHRFGVHNTPLTYAVDLGLTGLALWLLGLVFGVGGALATRGPPDLHAWRVGLLAVAMSFLVVVNSVPPTAWAHRSLWLLAGVVYAGRYVTAGPQHSSGTGRATLSP